MLQLLIYGLWKHYSKLKNMVTKDHMVSLIAHLIKNLPAMQETWVQFLGWEDPPEKEMAIHSSILPGKSYGQRSLAGYSPWGHKSQT